MCHRFRTKQDESPRTSATSRSAPEPLVWPFCSQSELKGRKGHPTCRPGRGGSVIVSAPEGLGGGGRRPAGVPAESLQPVPGGQRPGARSSEGAPRRCGCPASLPAARSPPRPQRAPRTVSSPRGPTRDARELGAGARVRRGGLGPLTASSSRQRRTWRRGGAARRGLGRVRAGAGRGRSRRGLEVGSALRGL